MCGHANFPFIFSHMHVGVQVCGQVCMCEHLCVEAGGQSEVSPLGMPSTLFESESLIGLELIV